MEQNLPVGTITYEENCQTTIDLVFTTPAITAGVVKCETERELDCGSDHLPILTRLLLEVVDSTPANKRNFNKTDSEKLKETLLEEINMRPCLYRPITGVNGVAREKINLQITAMIECIQEAINQSTPYIRICPRSKAGFTPECKEAQQRSKQMKRR